MFFLPCFFFEFFLVASSKNQNYIINIFYDVNILPKKHGGLFKFQNNNTIHGSTLNKTKGFIVHRSNKR